MTPNAEVTAPAQQGKKKSPRRAKTSLSAFESLSPESLRTLRLDDESRAEFDARVEHFTRSSQELQTIESEDVSSMDEQRFDQLAEAQKRKNDDATAVVHFLAPRILRLRDGEAKRKWRSLLTKFRKDTGLV